LNPRHYLLVDEALASNEVEAELFKLAAPEKTSVAVYSPRSFLDEAAAGRSWERAVLILRDPAGLLALIRGGFRPREVNLGGLHWHEGAEEILPYLYLNRADWELLEEAAAAGVRLTAQDLPGQRAVAWSALMQRRPGRAD
jgi:mannose/fructose/N-acetylgalactosamine-specific phosphotransferase system component IIB